MQKAVHLRDGTGVLRMTISALALGLAFTAFPTLGEPFSCAGAKAPAAAPSQSKTFDGEWVGPLVIGPIHTWAAIRISGDRAAAATGLGPFDDGHAAFEGGKAHVDLGEGGTLDGPVDFQGNVWAAHWVVKDAPDRTLQLVRRPQTPVPPLPYRSEDVTFRGADGTVVAGTVTAPMDTTPHPAVILLTGSQPADRDYVPRGAPPAHRPFAVLADRLTRQGFVVLRYDSRGVGGSGGSFVGDPEAQFEGDIVAALALLRARPDVDTKKVGLIGHSAGSVLAARGAVADPSVAFVVLLAPPGMPAKEFATAQIEAIGKSEGASDAELARRIKVSEALNAAALAASDPADAKVKVAQVAAELQREGIYKNLGQYDVTIALAPSDYYRFFLTHDPAADLRQLHQPVLVISGSKDILTPPDTQLPPIRAALKDNRQADVCVIPGLSHQLRLATTGSFEEAEASMITIDDTALDPIVSWLALHTR